MNSKSPFYVVEEFLSPLLCEEIIEICDFNVPDKDKDGHEIKTIKTNERAEAIIYERLLSLLPTLQTHYNFQYKGTEPMDFEWFPPGSKGKLHTENSVFVRGKWLRTTQRDFTGVLFLCDYQETPPFDQYYEVYGGKLEFPQHTFGFNPRKGTLILYPSGPHFINVTSDILVGDLYQVRFHLTSKDLFLYNPQMFPGNYLSWFNNDNS